MPEVIEPKVIALQTEFTGPIPGSMWKSRHKSEMRQQLQMREAQKQTSKHCAGEIANDGNRRVAPI
jgi:hypothetical protein